MMRNIPLDEDETYVKGDIFLKKGDEKTMYESWK